VPDSRLLSNEVLTTVVLVSACLVVTVRREREKRCGILALGSGAAWSLPVASGTGSCKFISGAGSLDNPLTKGGSAKVTKVTVTFKVDPHNDCSMKLTSPSGDVVKGLASLTGTATYTRAAGFANSCSNFIGGDSVKAQVTVKWVASTAIARTTATFGTGTYAAPTAGHSSGLTYSGAVAWSGSFRSTAAAGKVVLATSIPNLTACGSTGVTGFTISGSFVQA
jgi:hypothetical protein